MSQSADKPFIRPVLASAVVVIGVVIGVVALGRRESAPTYQSSLTLFQDRVAPGELAGFNVLLLTLDTTRRDHIGCYGFEAAETPVIDALAARGAVFDHAITDVPATLPAHSSILTGLQTPSHGVRTNGHYELDEGITTMAEVLKAQGYATAAWVNTFVLDARYGLDAGFDRYSGIKGPPGRRADAVTDDAIAWFKGRVNRDTPWFAWVHYFDPHKPYDAPGEFGTRFADSPYDGEIAFTDFHLGRLLDFLDEHGQIERTLIVLIADHGEGLGEHLEDTHSRLIYDTTMRVPLIISFPGLHDASCRIDDVTVATFDIMPTVMSLLGLETGLEMDGLDLVTAEVAADRTLYIETLAPLLYHDWAPLHGLRRIDAKYIEAPTPEYYDLAADPGELDNLLYEDPDADGGLAAALREQMSRQQSADPMPAAAPLSEEARRALAALGYVSSRDPVAPPPVTRPDPKDIHPLFNDLRRKKPRELYLMGLAMATTIDADRGTYRRALILVERVHALDPHNRTYLPGLGFARYRVGDYDGAMSALQRSARSFHAIAFRAMTLAKLGRTAEARAELDALRAMAADGGRTDDETALLAEVESTLR